MTHQGVTTVVLGQDGVSFAPSPPGSGAAEYADRYFAAINGSAPDVPRRVRRRAAGHLRPRDDGAHRLPRPARHPAVRGHGGRRPARPPDEVAAMVRLLEQGLDDGARGMSTGLEYAPASSARPCGAGRAVRRSWRAAVGRTSRTCAATRTGAPPRSRSCSTWRARPASAPTSRTTTARRAARAAGRRRLAEGLDLTFDSYPYLRGSSILALVALPGLAAAGRRRPHARPPAPTPRSGPRLPAARRRLAARHALVGPGLRRGPRGCRSLEVAARLGMTPADAALHLLVTTNLQVGCVFEQPPTNRTTRCGPCCGTPRTAPAPTASTAAATRTRAAGGRSRGYLGGHVRELGDWDWPTAAQHLSTTAARRFGLHGPRDASRLGAPCGPRARRPRDRHRPRHLRRAATPGDGRPGGARRRRPRAARRAAHRRPPRPSRPLRKTGPGTAHHREAVR